MSLVPLLVLPLSFVDSAEAGSTPLLVLPLALSRLSTDVSALLLSVLMHFCARAARFMLQQQPIMPPQLPLGLQQQPLMLQQQTLHDSVVGTLLQPHRYLTAGRAVHAAAIVPRLRRQRTAPQQPRCCPRALKAACPTNVSG